MARKTKPLSPEVIRSLPRRLYDAAEEFYFAAIIANIKFDAGNVYAYQNATDVNFEDPVEAVRAVINGPNKIDDVHAPRIANLAFSIELYTKLMIFMANGDRTEGHNLLELFERLEEIDPNVASVVIRK